MEKMSPLNDINPHDLNMVAFASSTHVQARNALLAVDTAMQENYATLKASLIPHLSPVIVVNNDGKGGNTHSFMRGAVSLCTQLSPCSNWLNPSATFRWRSTA